MIPPWLALTAAAAAGGLLFVAVASILACALHDDDPRSTGWLRAGFWAAVWGAFAVRLSVS